MLDKIPAPLAHFAGRVIDGWPWLGDQMSARVINGVVGTTRNRPHPWSTVSPYTSWRGLSDRSFLARHLPPKPQPATPKPEAEVAELFRRSGDSSCRPNPPACFRPSPNI